MPHYFFHLVFGDRHMPDEEGVELAGRSAKLPMATATYPGKPSPSQ
jgi:hypothetical protein